MPMPEKARKHAVMYVPRSGLFWTGRDFIDGRANRVLWSRTIPVWNSHAGAVAFRDRQRDRWRNMEGDFIVVSVDILEKDQPDGDDILLLESEEI